MSALQAAVFAMRASQTALQTIGNNLANVRTPGYHRQLVELGDRRPQVIDGLAVGQGVEVAEIRRLRDASVEAVLMQTTADVGKQTAVLDVLTQIESLLTPGEGTLHATVQKFFNQWEVLAAEPAESVQRQELLQSALQIADEINELSRSLNGIKLGLQSEIQSVVDEVNILSKNVAALNQEIQMIEARGVVPNDLYDKRDQLTSQLAALVDAEYVETGATTGVRLASGESFITTRSKELSFEIDPFSVAKIYAEGASSPVQLTSGRLAGLVQGYNEIVRQAEDRLAELTTGLIHAVNSIHATGLGAVEGAVDFKSTRMVIPTNVPLMMAKTDFPIQDGELVLGVTNTSTGIRTVHRLSVNPSAQTIETLTAAINAVSGVSASVDSTTGQVRITADPGVRFDFTGALPTQATVQSATGTSIPTLHGQYLGAQNNAWTATVVGSGQVGVDSGIQVELRNQQGLLLQTLSVGAGYAPGDPLTLPDGVVLRFPPGTLNAGDTFGIPLIAHSDTAGVLSAIGAFDLFTGNRPGNIAVDPVLLRNPRLLSVSQTGQLGDNQIALKFAALGGQPLLSGGTSTFVEFLSLASADAGLQVVQANRELEGLKLLTVSYTQQREALSGVNPDEELIRMLEFQRMFQSAAQLLTTVNDTLQTLFGIFR
ncbi:MAG: flagellar hook-associated protein FlgK [Planctomycetaceae bacterium]|nr:flagellar hook-associated protein FlgK [Planctomycetaceae bacterium]